MLGAQPPPQRARHGRDGAQPPARGRQARLAGGQVGGGGGSGGWCTVYVCLVVTCCVVCGVSPFGFTTEACTYSTCHHPNMHMYRQLRENDWKAGGGPSLTITLGPFYAYERLYVYICVYTDICSHYPPPRPPSIAHDAFIIFPPSPPPKTHKISQHFQRRSTPGR